MILVVQFREDVSLEHEQECIRLHVPEGQDVRFVSVFDENVDFSEPGELLSGVEKLILGGSGALVIGSGHPNNDLEKNRLVLNTIEPLMKFILEKDFPTLGACFGHHLIAHFGGGRVVFDADMAETGVLEITQKPEAHRDPILKGVPEKFLAVVGHQDSVTDLPAPAVVLASSERCPVQLVRFGKNVYGAQFHGELTSEQLVYRLKLYPHYKQYAKSLKLAPTPHAVQVLDNFLTLPVTANV